MSKILLVVVALFVLVGGAVGIYFATLPPPTPAPNIPEQIPVTPRHAVATPPKVRFTDITEKAGIHFKHVNGASGKKLLPETMGSGVAFLDYDNDGLQDILLINGRPWPGDEGGPPPTLALYRNKGDGTFEDVTAAVGLNVPLYGMGVCVGDIDNDGYPDIFVTAIGGNKLFHNIGGKRFEDITEKAGLGGNTWPVGSREQFLAQEKPIPWPTSATFLDYDGDGKLDLFVCQYVTWSPKHDLGLKSTLKGTTRAYGPPKEFSGSQCILYRNIDGLHFEDVSAKAGIHVVDALGTGQDAIMKPAAKALGVIVCDPDGDGWPDIIVANDTVRNFFFHNVAGANGERRFEEIALNAGVAYTNGSARGAMGIDFGEFMPEMRALAVANFADEPMSFFCQDRPRSLRFTEQAQAIGLSALTAAPLKFGTFYFDYDLDGRLDILSNNGHLEPDIAKLQEGQKYAQSPQLFWNTGCRPGCFEKVTANEAGMDLFQPLVGRGSAFADIDGNGTLDVILTANNSAPRLLRNDNDTKNHWVRFSLEGDGKRSNRSAIGAVVTLEAGGEKQTRAVTSGRGYLSQSELPLTFGLGKTDKIDKVTIRWPGKDAGPPTVLTEIAIDKMHKVKQQ